MVLFELRSVLNTLQLYTNEWNLDVNVSNTKVVIFRNGVNNRTNEKWLYNSENLEIVNQFVYIGVVFNCNGIFFTTQKQLATQGRKAKFALKSIFNQLNLNHCTLFPIFGYMWTDKSNLNSNSRIYQPIIRKRLKDNFIQTRCK